MAEKYDKNDRLCVNCHWWLRFIGELGEEGKGICCHELPEAARELIRVSGMSWPFVILEYEGDMCPTFKKKGKKI